MRKLVDKTPDFGVDMDMNMFANVPAAMAAAKKVRPIANATVIRRANKISLAFYSSEDADYFTSHPPTVDGKPVPTYRPIRRTNNMTIVSIECGNARTNLTETIRILVKALEPYGKCLTSQDC